jgi:hypothetical protein
VTNETRTKCDSLNKNLTPCKRNAVTHVPATAFTAARDLCKKHERDDADDWAAFNRRNA